MARIMLVRGAFGGAWAWEPALAGLRDAGHTVEAIDLPAAGEDKTPVSEVTVLEIDADHWPWLSRTDEFHAVLERLVLATSLQPH